jgi:hypothetical protein
MATMRTLHLANPLEHGPDVRRAQTVLHKHGYLDASDVDGSFGPHSAHASELAKYKLGYPAIAIKPTFGDQLNGYLTGKLALPKDYQEREHARAGVPYVVFEQQALRAKIATIAHWGVANTGQIHYQQRRPIDGINHPYQLPLYTDCSGFVTLCYHWAGAPDPNGRGYDGLGFTGTLLQHMKSIMKSQVKIGDVVVYGAYPGHHTCLVVEAGGDPLLVSHGSENDPHFIRHSVESQYQPHVVTWLRLPEWV